MTQPHIDIWHSHLGNLILFILLSKFYIYFIHWYSTTFIFLLQILHFTLRFCILQFCISSFYILHWQFTFHTDILHLYFSFYTDFKFHICNIHFTFYIVHSRFYILHSKFYILHFTVDIWQLTFDTDTSAQSCNNITDGFSGYPAIQKLGRVTESMWFKRC